ncbi:hypothetical protein Godav_011985, partial [Gossypium davidsonii]|nr:hypothetical protein [Gossypium davidsonii]
DILELKNSFDSLGIIGGVFNALSEVQREDIFSRLLLDPKKSILSRLISLVGNFVAIGGVFNENLLGVLMISFRYGELDNKGAAYVMFIRSIEVTKLGMAKARAIKIAVKMFYSKGWYEKVPLVIQFDLCVVLKWLLIWSYKPWMLWNLV